MNASFFKSVFPVAVGAGVMIGAAGVFLYDHFFREKRRVLLQKEVANLDVGLAELRRELENIKSLQQRVRRRRKMNPAHSDAETEMFSTFEDEGDDEFYDFSESEEEGLEANRSLRTLEYVNSKRLSLAEAKKQALGQAFDEVDSLLEGNTLDQTRAYDILLDMLESKEEDPDPEVLWRLAKVCHMLSGNVEIESDIPKRQEYLSKGMEYAERCLHIAPRSSDAHKWFAICIGARSQHLGSREKVKDGLEFLRHVEQAIQLSPDDGTLHHLLGRFKFEVATLSWVERKIASTLFGEVPSATFEEALESLFRAEELSGDPWKENRLLIAKCYLNLRDNSSASIWLGRADQVPVKSPEDRVADFEIKAMLEKYNVVTED